MLQFGYYFYKLAFFLKLQILEDPIMEALKFPIHRICMLTFKNVSIKNLSVMHEKCMEINF